MPVSLTFSFMKLNLLILKVSVLLFCFGLFGCTTSPWKPLNPPVDNALGLSATASGELVVIGANNPISTVGVRTMTSADTFDSEDSKAFHASFTPKVLEVLTNFNASGNLGLTCQRIAIEHGSHLFVDVVTNWYNADVGVTFIWQAKRAEEATVAFTNDTKLTADITAAFKKTFSADVTVTNDVTRLPAPV